MSPRTKITLTYGLPFVVGVAVFFVFYLLARNSVNPVIFYQEKMRGSLFAGFLTLGSFLLSLKTGIVIKIKENLYDQGPYQDAVEKAIEQGSNMTVYGPLQRLSRLLATAVLSALIASVLQLTLGLLGEWWTVAICLAAAATAITFLMFAFTLIQMNMRDWFKYLEEVAEKKRLSGKKANS